MVNSMKQIYKKVILTSFSVEPRAVPRLECFLAFGRRSAYRIPHPYPVQRILSHGMRIIKTAGAIAIDGSLQCIHRRLLAISASKLVE